MHTTLSLPRLGTAPETCALARLSFDRAPAWHLLSVAGATALAVLALMGSAGATTGPLPPSQLSLQPAVVELGQPVTLRVDGTAGELPIVLASLFPGPFFVPRVGTLDVGFGAGSPLFVFLPPVGTGGSIAISGATECNWPVAGIPIFLQAVTLGAQGHAPASLSNPSVLQFVSGNCGGTARGAEPDAACSATTERAALSLPGLATDLRFVPGAQFLERPDGTARLVGVAVRDAAPGSRLAVDVTFSGRIDPGGAHFPPGGSPLLDLFPNAYWPTGFVRPSTWHYYAEVEGSLVGAGDWTGGRMLVSESVTDVQAGLGANGRNLRWGAYGRLRVETAAQPTAGSGFPVGFGAPGELTLDLDATESACATAPGPIAVRLPGISTQLRLLDGATFTESAGGATLSGVLVDAEKSSRRLRLEATFTGLVSPGSPAHPPLGAPWLDLNSSSYAGQGGSVDPSTWHYYTSWSGTLVGEEGWVGALVSFQGQAAGKDKGGPGSSGNDGTAAFQVGFGANGVSLDMGGSARIAATVVSQPNKGEKFKAENDGGWVRLALGICP